jgi:hypothetical protein
MLGVGRVIRAYMCAFTNTLYLVRLRHSRTLHPHSSASYAPLRSKLEVYTRAGAMATAGSGLDGIVDDNEGVPEELQVTSPATQTQTVSRRAGSIRSV